MKVCNYFICFFLLFEIQTSAQNLIRNSNFDSYNTFLDSNKNLVYQPEFWFYNITTPNHPIYYSTERFFNKSLKYNYHPDAELIEKGQKLNYISILILPNTQKVYTELQESLVKGQRYRLQIDVKAYDQSSSLSDLLVGFKDCLNCDMDSSLYQLRLPIPDSLCNESLYNKWITLSADFIAKGIEKVLVISSGSPKDYLKIINSNRKKFVIKPLEGPILTLKYFIDNVVLSEIESNKDSPLTKEINSLNIGESIILNNIYFDFDKYELLKESYPELDIVSDYLNKNSDIQILISGYTDNIGTSEYNNVLSNNRARSVVDYLIKKGISKDRLQSQGFGLKFPIDSNETEEGRKKNRRIEMKIIRK